MAYENWQKVREVFDAALRQEPADRQNYLNEACGDDKALLTEVESLFSSLAKSDEFLETPAVTHVADIIESPKKPFAPGTRFGPFEIVGFVGAGGMGAVYRGYDPRLRREVAIKMLMPAFANDPDRLRRFEQEALAVARLAHPNILAVHDIGTHDGAPYLVMELLEGETLRDKTKGQPLPVRRAIEYAAQIARGLAAAHDREIVPRDIKPENVFITRDGRVKILDFGIAKLTDQDSAPGATAVTVTVEGAGPIGTAAYMSPEQARGGRADHRDRKSTRLNSSHGYISYAVFCLKKKKTKRQNECSNADLE